MRIIITTILISAFSLFAVAQYPRTTLVVDDSEDNLVKEICLVRADNQNIKEGTWQQFFNDKLITKGRYSNNKKDGRWEYYGYNDELDFSGNYNQDRKEGKWVYTLNGKPSAELYYTNGAPDSLFGYYENGNPAVQMWRYNDGSGLIKTYYDNGNLKEIQPTLNGKPHGVYEIRFKNGQLHRRLDYRQGRVVSAPATFDMEGNPINGGSLHDGNGNLVAYYLRDTTAVLPVKKYLNLGFKNVAVNGIASYYFENGNLESSGFTEAGRTVGEWKYYKDDGSLLHVINYDYSPFTENRETISAVAFSGDNINTGQRNPGFPGGEDLWLEFLENTIRYPKDAADFPELGIVYVDFVIDDVGAVRSKRVVRSVNQAFDEEALRVLDAMPRWNPGLSYGIPVSMTMNMPLSFNIE